MQVGTYLDRELFGKKLPEGERQVVALIWTFDWSDKQIARRLGVTESAVARRLERAFARLGVHSRTAACRAALGSGYDLHPGLERAS